jgi:polyribonucleotide nucleotidyltransferase
MEFNMKKQIFETEIGGKKLSAEFNDLADQTNGSVLVKLGETAVLITAVMGDKDKDGDFFPLTVDFEERFYASGKILGNRFQRREGRPSEEAILAGRIIDRTIRPLFESYIRREVQIVITTLAIGEEDPDSVALIGSSLALATSDIPWNGPVSGVRLTRNKGDADFSVNPKLGYEDAENFEFESFICGKDGNINMIEVAGKEISEIDANLALQKASAEIEKLQTWQKEIVAKVGKQKIVLPKPVLSEKVLTLWNEKIAPQITEKVYTQKAGNEGIHGLLDIWKKLLEENEIDEKEIALALAFSEEKIDNEVHRLAVEENKRADGRGFDEIRPLFAQAGGVSSVLHGSGIFYRGGTHVLSVLTLGGPQDAMTVEDMGENEETKRFIHHYNFPPYSSGETGRMGGINRRAIGHGALAEKALKAVIPNKEIFPYTIRLVSESLASNGSTSQASICAGCLALMDGGVPITSPVAGIASGLMMKNSNEYKLLTDIQGPEDHYGDMDFKVAGTKNGITAVQMDVKVDGIPLKILAEAFEKARLARLQILEVITSAIPEPRKDLNSNAPKILMMKIDVDKIGLVIGGQGKTIKDITEKSGAEIVIEDDGSIFITGKNGTAEKAQEMISALVREYKIGEKVVAKIVKFIEVGAIAEFGSESGLIHVSEISGTRRIAKPEDVLKLGQEIEVLIKDIRVVDGRKKVSLSIKAINPDLIK